MEKEIETSSSTYIEPIKIYTDGSTKKNPGDGGAAAITIINDIIIGSVKYCGSKTTNNMAELQGIIIALEYLIENGYTNREINVYSDSKYALNCASGGYKLTEIKKNKILVETLQKLVKQFSMIKLFWIKGHTCKKSSNFPIEHFKWNHYADLLAKRVSHEKNLILIKRYSLEEFEKGISKLEKELQDLKN